MDAYCQGARISVWASVSLFSLAEFDYATLELIFAKAIMESFADCATAAAVHQANLRVFSAANTMIIREATALETELFTDIKCREAMIG